MDAQTYLRRINYQGSLTPDIDLLRSLHRVHLFTVPFEDLDIHLGREIVCDESRILHKIVNEKRGGFCYELNGAFAALLRALGFRVTLLSCRVARHDGGYSPEFDHLTLRVDLEEPWLADVGFGDCFLEPLRLKPGMEQPKDGRIYRLPTRMKWLATADAMYNPEVLAEGGWKKEYWFTLQPCALSDFVGMGDYHQTSTDSTFMCSRFYS